MLASLLATACFAGSPAEPVSVPVRAAAATPEGNPLKAADSWLRLWRKGKIDIYNRTVLQKVPLVVDWRPPEISSKQSFAVKFGIAPKGGLGTPTWLGDLELIAEALAELDNSAAAQALLEIAAAGLDGKEYARESAPHAVRAVGEKYAVKLQSAAARELIVAAARGELRLSKQFAVPMQGAALRCLGAFADEKDRSVIEPMLAHTERMVRFHAAEALARLGDEKAALALIAALEREADEIVLPAVVEALRSIYSSYLPKLKSRPREDEKPTDDGGFVDPTKPEQPEAADKPEPADKPQQPEKQRPPPESTRLAARAAIGALGRSTWRADMALLRFLDDFRAKESIPAMIAILERFRDNPDQVQSGKLSNLVQHRAHELLVTMTGAVYPATQPEKWRALWDTEKDKIEVGQRRAAPEGQAHTVASGFAGIPVQGSRVLFILDLSRSMTFAMTKARGTGDNKEQPKTRIDYARRELQAAIDALPEKASFNLVSFDGNANAKSWNRDMLPATARNREKFKKYVDGVRPDGGTNLWSALETALKIKSLVYGDRYETNVDEIFILSDGAPSVGEVLDPIQILRLVKESNKFSKMRINTVFISSPNEEERRQRAEWMTIKPEELMRRLAEENGGKCVIL